MNIYSYPGARTNYDCAPGCRTHELMNIFFQKIKVNTMNLSNLKDLSKDTTGRLLTVGLLLCFFIAFCRGFYMPSVWSTNYWLINFFDGFGKRALLGTLLYPFGDLRLHYHFLFSVQLAASAALLYLVITRLATWQQKQSGNPYIYIYIYI